MKKAKGKIGKVGKGKRQRRSTPQRGKAPLSKAGKDMLRRFNVQSRRGQSNDQPIV